MTTKGIPAALRSGWMCALLVLAPAAARAESDVLQEIEVKARKETRVDTMEVREVRETPSRDLGEALDAAAGAAKVRKAGIANDVVVRGMKKDDVAVLIDGQELHGACPSRMDPPSFHLDYAEVDRVEVKKGPYDVSHPGGLGGLVDVRTRRAHLGPGAELNMGFGSFAAFESSGVLSWASERADVMAGGAAKSGHPYADGDGRSILLAIPDQLPTAPGATTLAPNGARYRNPSPGQNAYEVKSAWLKAGFAPGQGQRAEVSYTRQSATDVLYPYLLMDGLRDDTDRVNAQYTIAGRGALERGLLQVYWNRVEHDMTDARRCSSAVNAGLAPTPAGVAACGGALPRDYGMRTLAASSMWGAKAEGQLDRWGGLLVGADFHLRNWDNVTTRAMRALPGVPYADEASVPDVTMTGLGLYAQSRVEVLEGLAVTVGARLDVVGSRAGVDRTALYRVFHPGAARERTDVLPSGNVQLDWTVARGATVFAGFGHGVRVPDPQERYFALTGMAGKPAWVGDPFLRPVRNDEVDVGAKLARGPLLLKAQAFHSWLGDYVSMVNVTVGSGASAQRARTYAGVAARTFGGEASARVALPARLYAAAGLSFARGINDTTGLSLAEMPPLKASASLRWDLEWLFAEAEEVWAARQDKVDLLLGEQPTPPWWITNLKLGVEKDGVKLFAGVRNLFDRAYAEHLSYLRDPFGAGVRVNEPGRTVYANMQYQF
jgi:iron complex outermembrane receptor protein